MADDPEFLVVRIAFELDRDIDDDAPCDAKDLDRRVLSCLSLAEDALSERLNFFPEFEREQIKQFVNGMRHSHLSIRKLLVGQRSPCSVDALAIARLQIENVFTACYLLESQENARLFVKNAWKSKFERFLLHRQECAKLARFSEFYASTGLVTLNALQSKSSVTYEERETIEVQQLGVKKDSQWKPTRIPGFPTPAKVAKKIKSSDQRRMLARLNAEYEYLCSFAHGDNESVVFRAIVDPRSNLGNLWTSSEVEDFYQRQVLEPPIYYSALGCLLVATEVAASYPDAVELKARLAETWGFLLKRSLWFHFGWELRGKSVRGIVG